MTSQTHKQQPIILSLAYSGLNYYGLQRQKTTSNPGIQNVLEKALSRLYRQAIETSAAGRTDRLVSADELRFLFKAPYLLSTKIATHKLPSILNRYLPADIQVLHAQTASKLSALAGFQKGKKNEISKTIEFHPRFSATVRLYRYRLSNKEKDPLEGNLLASTLSCLPKNLDEKRLRSYFQHFEGEHDFTSFCSAGENSLNKHRRIYAIDLLRSPPYFFIDMYANAFLQGMVRSIIGNTLALYKKNIDPSYVQTMLKAKNPCLAKARAKASALSLRKVYYTPIFLSEKTLNWN